jgi:hypothetical protein
MTLFSMAFLLALLLLTGRGIGLHAAAIMDFHWKTMAASFVIMLGLLQLASVAMALAARLRLAPVLFLLMAVLIAGLLSDYMITRNSAGAVIPLFLRALPDWSAFWTADMLANNGTVPVGYIAVISRYSILYTVGIICFGAAIFGRSETV